MADTNIEWADKVWNPLVGCSYQSPGCTNCYAVDLAWIRSHHPDPRIAAKFAGTVAKTAKGARHWTGRINFDEAALLAPLRWKKPRRIFVNSMADLFHAGVTDEQIDRVFAIMALCPQHQFLILTKRAERMREYVAALPNRDDLLERACLLTGGFPSDADKVKRAVRLPLPNVWLGVSVENQQAADERIPHLLATPAAVRWISAEPLLGPVDLGSLPWEKSCDCVDHTPTFHALEGTVYCAGCCEGAERVSSQVDWVVTGGESGKHARPMHPDWARSLRDQCAAAGVAFNFKQWGEWVGLPGSDGFWPHDKPSACRLMNDGTKHPRGKSMQRVGKHHAGRLLDGVLHDAMPQVPA